MNRIIQITFLSLCLFSPLIQVSSGEEFACETFGALSQPIKNLHKVFSSLSKNPKVAAYFHVKGIEVGLKDNKLDGERCEFRIKNGKIQLDIEDLPIKYFPATDHPLAQWSLSTNCKKDDEFKTDLFYPVKDQRDTIQHEINVNDYHAKNKDKGKLEIDLAKVSGTTAQFPKEMFLCSNWNNTKKKINISECKKPDAGGHGQGQQTSDSEKEEDEEAQGEGEGTGQPVTLISETEQTRETDKGRSGRVIPGVNENDNNGGESDTTGTGDGEAENTDLILTVEETNNGEETVVFTPSTEKEGKDVPPTTTFTWTCIETPVQPSNQAPASICKIADGPTHPKKTATRHATESYKVQVEANLGDETKTETRTVKSIEQFRRDHFSLKLEKKPSEEKVDLSASVEQITPEPKKAIKDENVEYVWTCKAEETPAQPTTAAATPADPAAGQPPASQDNPCKEFKDPKNPKQTAKRHEKITYTLTLTAKSDETTPPFKGLVKTVTIESLEKCKEEGVNCEKEIKKYELKLEIFQDETEAHKKTTNVYYLKLTPGNSDTPQDIVDQYKDLIVWKCANSDLKPDYGDDDEGDSDNDEGSSDEGDEDDESSDEDDDKRVRFKASACPSEGEGDGSKLGTKESPSAIKRGAHDYMIQADVEQIDGQEMEIEGPETEIISAIEVDCNDDGEFLPKWQCEKLDDDAPHPGSAVRDGPPPPRFQPLRVPGGFNFRTPGYF
jgi:hypothetical protein